MTEKIALSRRLSVAPMMDYTDRHYRYFMRLITKHTLLYTEMVTSWALLHGDVNRFLQFNDSEHPVALQLGGNNPHDLAKCVRLAEEYGYDEVNLNLGCPSSRVRNGAFGACLMREPELVADCFKAMQDASVNIPVTLKTRLGVDNDDSFEFFSNFIETQYLTGCRSFTIHARKAWLNGLSPKQNRHIPPLNYDSVYKIKKSFPFAEFILNGGLINLQEAKQHLQHVDGVMIGREAYRDPYGFAVADGLYFESDTDMISREAIISKYQDYAERELAKGQRISALIKPILNLYQGEPGAKRWRQYLSEQVTSDRFLLGKEHGQYLND